MCSLQRGATVTPFLLFVKEAGPRSQSLSLVPLAFCKTACNFRASWDPRDPRGLQIKRLRAAQSPSQPPLSRSRTSTLPSPGWGSPLHPGKFTTSAGGKQTQALSGRPRKEMAPAGEGSPSVSHSAKSDLVSGLAPQISPKFPPFSLLKSPVHPPRPDPHTCRGPCLPGAAHGAGHFAPVISDTGPQPQKV